MTIRLAAHLILNGSRLRPFAFIYPHRLHTFTRAFGTVSGTARSIALGPAHVSLARMPTQLVEVRIEQCILRVRVYSNSFTCLHCGALNVSYRKFILIMLRIVYCMYSYWCPAPIFTYRYLLPSTNTSFGFNKRSKVSIPPTTRRSGLRMILHPADDLYFPLCSGR